MALIAKKVKTPEKVGVELIPVKVPEGRKSMDQYTGETKYEGEVFMMDKNQSILLLGDGSVVEATDEEVDEYNAKLIAANPSLAPAPAPASPPGTSSKPLTKADGVV